VTAQRVDYLAVVTAALAEQVEVPATEIAPADPLVGIPGIESVKVLRAVMVIEEACQVMVPDDFLFEVATVAELADRVAELAAPAGPPEPAGPGGPAGPAGSP
jgi:acyl carrier protein